MITTDRLRADLDNAAAGTPVAAPDIPTLIGRGRRRRRQRRALLAGAAAVAVVAVAAGAGALATHVRRDAAPLPPAASPTSASPKPLTAVPRPPADLVRVSGFEVAAWPSLGVAYDRTHHRYRYFPDSYALPAPVGTRIVLVSESAGGARKLSMYDTATGTTRPVPVDANQVSEPRWSPDGSRLVFTTSTKTGEAQVGFVLVDAATLVAHKVMLPFSQYPIMATLVQWTPDGTHLIAGMMVPGSTYSNIDHLQLFTLDGTPAGTVPATAEAPETGAWSPDRSRFVSLNTAEDGTSSGYDVFDARSGQVVGRLPVLAGSWWIDDTNLLLYNGDTPTAVSEVDTSGTVVGTYPIPRLSTRDAVDLLLYPHG